MPLGTDALCVAAHRDKLKSVRRVSTAGASSEFVDDDESAAPYQDWNDVSIVKTSIGGLHGADALQSRQPGAVADVKPGRRWHHRASGDRRDRAAKAAGATPAQDPRHHRRTSHHA